MNRTFILLAGILLTVVASFAGLVLVPNWQFSGLKPYTDENTNVAHPTQYYGANLQGRAVYTDLGCLYCHSQQVRTANFGADIDRGWGTRRSVARDYIYDNPPLLGTMRTGPDLHNIGARQTSSNWHYLHLYDPQITSPGSVMPPHPFLFQRLEGKAPKEGAQLPATYAKTESYIVPTERGRVLVEYLKSLDHSYELPEAK